jgi:glycosyltransferase involved in cell wall biosynthesis
MRIAVCRPMVPFVHGGAEVVADTLADELRARDHEVELVTLPFAWDGTRAVDNALQWRLIDLSGAPKPVELVIGTKFPSYGIRHPNKVIWLVHQFRQAYDFDRGEFGQFSESPLDRATRDAVERFDRVAFSEARKIFTISGNVAGRLKRYTGFDATVLPPPPQKLAYRTEGYDGFVLSVNRLDRYKRIDLLIEAVKSDPELRAVIVGDGPDRGRLERLATGMNGRIEFTGRVDGDDLVDLYSRCLAVYYAPVDEDYGMVPFEAFLSAKPVVTTVDAGGPLEVVHDGETGVVVGPDPDEIARACSHLVHHVDEARSLGEAGKAVAERITWDACIDALLS